MRFDPYRKVLVLPAVRSLMLVAFFARIPVMAVGVTLTLHVVHDLDRGYGEAGLVGAVATIATALGAPLLGRLIDRRGLRLTLLLTLAVTAVWWAVAPQLSYGALLAVAAVGGFFTVPVFSVVRQSLAALVGGERRRQAYAIDSMAVELSFMIGPAVAIILVAQLSALVAMYVVGAALVVSGGALLVLDPPVRGSDEEAAGAARPARRQWFTGRLVAVFAVAAASTCVVAGTDLSIIAALETTGQDGWIALVLPLWGAASLVGGFVYGALPRAVPLVWLLALLGLLTIPIGLAEGPLWLSLAVLPAGLLCAPSLAASAEAVSRLVPAGARGEAMGWHGSALTFGLAAGAPLAGSVIDAAGAGWGFAAAGAAGVAVAALLAPLNRRLEAPTGPEAPQVVEDLAPASA